MKIPDFSEKVEKYIEDNSGNSEAQLCVKLQLFCWNCKDKLFSIIYLINAFSAAFGLEAALHLMAPVIQHNV